MEKAKTQKKKVVKAGGVKASSARAGGQKIVSQGRVIDFVPRRNGVSLSKRPLSLSAPETPNRLRVATTSSTVVRPVRNGGMRATTVSRTVATPRRTNASGQRVSELSAAAAGMTVGEMMRRQRVTTKKMVEKFDDDEFGVIEERDVVRETVSAMATEPKKSPFLNSVRVDKRPLGKGGNKNVYERKKVSSPVHRIEPTTVVKPASKKSTLPLVGLIVLTVIIGGAVGAAVYLLFFQ